jgi:hypothetical protein
MRKMLYGLRLRSFGHVRARFPRCLARFLLLREAGRFPAEDHNLGYAPGVPAKGECQL